MTTPKRKLIDDEYQADTVKRARLRGAMETMQALNLIGQGKGQFTRQTIYELHGIPRSSAQKILKDRIDDTPIPFHLNDPGARIANNDPRNEEKRGGNRLSSGFSLFEAAEVDKTLTAMVKRQDSSLRELMRMEWTEIVENFGYETDATEGTIARLMRNHGWHSCVERRKTANERDIEKRREQAAIREIKNGRWAIVIGESVPIRLTSGTLHFRWI